MSHFFGLVNRVNRTKIMTTPMVSSMSFSGISTATVAPIMEPITTGGIKNELSLKRYLVRCDLGKLYTALKVRNMDPTRLVALAVLASRPMNKRSGKVKALPFPAIVFMIPMANPPAINAIIKYHSIWAAKVRYICGKVATVPENKDYRIIVKTLFGLEEVLANELRTLGGRNVEKINRAVACDGDLGFVYKVNIAVRTGLRVLVPVREFYMRDVEDYYDAIKSIPWEEHFSVKKTFSFHVVGGNDFFNHTNFAALKAKDAVVDRFRERTGKRPFVDRHEAQVPLHVHIYRDKVSVYFDSSGQSLHKRGYRLQAGMAAINEVLAAGIILNSKWNGGMPVVDPMCGSGTFLVEAALIAHNMPPNIYRKEFAFEHWDGFDPVLLEKIKDGLLGRAKEYNGKIMGRDINPEALDIAAANIERSMFDDCIRLKREDFLTSKAPFEKGLLLLNPPYNVRIEAETIRLYKEIGNHLKREYAGWTVLWISSDMEAMKHIGLRPSRKWNMFNGELECKLLQFELYSGSVKQKYKKR